MKQFFKFAVVGGTGTVINLAVLYILTEYAGIYYLFSAVVAFFLAMTNNFTLNKVWTFGEALHHKTASKFFKFFIVSVSALAVNLFFLYILTEFFGLYYIVSQLLAIGSALVVNFTGNKLWTFQKDISSL